MHSSSRRPWVIALALLLVPVAALWLRALWVALDLDPAPIFLVNAGGLGVAVACWVALPAWFFTSRRFTPDSKRVALGWLLIAGGLAVAGVRQVGLDGNLRPYARWRWQPRPADPLTFQPETNAPLPPIDLTVDPVNDFPRYRGALGDGRFTGTALLAASWERAAPALVWKRPVRGGLSGMAVAGNVLVTMEQHGDREAVVSYDRATGRERWRHSYLASFRHPTGSGPRATPTLADGEVYALGALCDLVCLDGKTGRPKWAVNVLTDNQAKRVAWGMTGSPLVVDDLVIVNAGVDEADNAGRALAAYRRADGARAWGSGTSRAGYSSPQLATLAGRRQVLLFDAAGLGGYDVATGAELWRFPWVTGMDMNIAQPLAVGGDRAFLSSEPKNGCALVRVAATAQGLAAEEVWRGRAMYSKFCSPVSLGGAIYGLSGGRLVCLDLQTGARVWRGARDFGNGQVLALNGAVLVQGEWGEVALVSADRRGYREAGRFQALEGHTWNTPAVAGRHLFVRNAAEMACYELPVVE